MTLAASQSAGRDPRALGLGMCTALVIGNIIGTGVFLLPASLAPFGLNALTGWIVTLVGCGFITVTFSVLARAFPRDDGPYAYTKRAFGDATAFMVMWCYWVSTWVTNATIAIAVVGYLTVLVPWLSSSPWLPPTTALGLLWLLVLVNFRGARTAGWVQVLTTVLKLLPLVGIILLGLWLLFTQPAIYLQNVPPNKPAWGEISSASTLALFAMLGIECATIPAGRVRDPERTIPAATIIGSAVTAIVYLGVSILPILLIPQQSLAASNAPFADVFSRVLGGGFGRVVAFFVVISGLGALNGWTLLVGEVTQSLARYGGLPGLARENRYGAPAIAFVLTGAIASIMMLTSYGGSIGLIFVFMSVVVTAANLPLYFVCALAVPILVRQGEITAGRTRAIVLSAAGILATAYCVWATIGIGMKPLLWTLALSAVGVVVYLWSSPARRRLHTVRVAAGR